MIPRRKKTSTPVKANSIREKGSSKPTRKGKKRSIEQSTQAQRSSEPTRQGKKRSSEQSTLLHVHGPSTSHPDAELCEEECESKPDEADYQSIASDNCNKWFHHFCADIKGNETFMFIKNLS